MKHKIYFMLFVSVISFSFIQAQTIKLSFKGESDSLHIPLDSIFVENLTQGGDTLLYYPDTTLLLDFTTGFNEYTLNSNDFYITQNYPNPFMAHTSLDIYIPEDGHLIINVYDISGKKVASSSDNYRVGNHKFSFMTGKTGFYILSITFKNETHSIKMFSMGKNTYHECDINYIGSENINTYRKSIKAKNGINFTFGDVLRYVGYYQSLTDAKISIPSQDTLIIFTFQSSKICFPTFIDARDGNVYSAVKIGDQCWMAENLNVGSRIDGVDNQSNNIIIEKYCYNDDTAYCNIYGGLYQWDEIMNYQTIESSQGICPCGWHVPADTSWTILSDYLGGNMIAGGHMKEAGLSHWITPNLGATNSSGFTALPAGYKKLNGLSREKGEISFLWSSTQASVHEAWDIQLGYDNEMANATFDLKTYGFSVRCLKDTIIQLPTPAYGGPDTLSVSGDSIALMGNTPVYGQGLWSIISGNAGYLADSTKPTTMFYGLPSMKYILVWEIGNNCGNSSDTVIVQFDTNFHNCGDPLVDTRNWLSYKTVRIGDQCWMAENLNIGTRIDGNTASSDNGIIEKYCYNNLPSKCNLYGGMYSWNEMMQYVSSSGTQGICPNGWHIPTNNEWKVLQGTVDTQFDVGDSEWNIFDNVGYDAGLNLVSTQGWYVGCKGLDLFGFCALPGGWYQYGSYYNFGACFWTSGTHNYHGVERSMNCNFGQISNSSGDKNNGQSIRCIRSCSPLPSVSNAGSDDLNIDNDSIELMANQPLNGLGLWSIIYGSGGYFKDSSSPNSVFYGLPEIPYKLVWTINNNCGSSSDTIVISFANNVFVCGDSIVDIRDWQSYNTIQIGTQCWMAENLNIGARINNINNQTDNDIIEKYCYNEDINNCIIYGGLYQWDEMMQYVPSSGTHGICPGGWHLPTNEEWTILTDYLGGQLIAGGKMKEQGIVHWISPNSGATNSSGFTALPSGYANINGEYNELGTTALIWSSTEYNVSSAWDHYLTYDSISINSLSDAKTINASVRCLKDTCNKTPTQAIGGHDSYNTIGDSIILNANIPISGIGIWSMISGNGGIFSDVSDPSSTFYGQVDSSYTLRWTISTSCNSTIDDVNISFGSGPQACPGIPSFTYGGQIYNTLKIGDDCWMAENLNIGTMIGGWSDQTNNGILEKFCYNDNTSDCNIYGGLYEWGEMMQYGNSPGTQGICPTGWHLPTDEEWKSLEGSVDSRYNMDNQVWDQSGYRGFDVGESLKSNSTWSSGGNGTDLYGFNVVASGYYRENYDFFHKGLYTYFWSSSDTSSNAWIRFFNYNKSEVFRGNYHKNSGFSVRCVLDCRPLPSQSYAGVDSLNIDTDSIVLSANTPIIGQGLWRIIYGTGGYLTDPTNPNSVFYGQPRHTYYLVWTISNICGDASDTVMINFKDTPCPSIPTFTYGGQTYNTALIGNQCWMKENLNIGTHLDGSINQTNNGIIEKYCYADDTINCEIYGGLYKWYEMMQYVYDTATQGICPPDWHIPSDEEWKILEGTVDSQFGIFDPEWNKKQALRGFDAGLNLKSHSGWNNNGNGSDMSGFSALPGGYYNSFGGILARFWTSTTYSSSKAYFRRVDENNDEVWRDRFNKYKAFSVRCLKNCSPKPNQSDAGQDSLNIIGLTYTLMANTPINANGEWEKLSGVLGYFADMSDPTTTFYGVDNETYSLVWTISNSCGISKDTIVINFASQTFVCGNSLVDIRDGHHYSTVQIGSQCWMSENLNFGTRIEGSYYQTDNGLIEKYCYNDIVDSCDVYGGLYQWNEMMQYVNDTSAQGICPPDWHIPSDDEWKVLEGTVDSQYGINNPEWNKILEFRGYDAGLNLKSTIRWNSGGNGNDLYGYNALPMGVYSNILSFIDLGESTSLWTSTKYNSLNAWHRKLIFSSSKIYRGNNGIMQNGFSVRCLKGCTPQPTPSELGTDSLTIIGNSIILMGNVPINGQGLWSVVKGIGGYLADSTNPTSLFYGISGQSYDLAWTISNNCGNSSDTVVIRFINQVFVCGDTIIDTRNWQSYNTVQIGSQCWMAENLNIGTRIDGNNNQTENDTIEKYCYDDIEASCSIYGGLYLWDEMMQYITDTASQGICPIDWHIPTDYEWKVLEGEVDSQFGIGDLQWEFFGFRGHDAGLRLKSISGWYLNGNGIDLYGFSALPGGSFDNPTFGYFYSDAFFWTSTKSSGTKAIFRSLTFSTSEINRNFSYKEYGYFIRCLRD